MCVIINKDKTLSRDLQKLIGNVRWILQNKSLNELVSLSTARWHDQHALPPLGEGHDITYYITPISLILLLNLI